MKFDDENDNITKNDLKEFLRVFGYRDDEIEEMLDKNYYQYLHQYKTYIKALEKIEKEKKSNIFGR